MPDHSQKSTHGPIAQVPCPWCEKSNDLREIEMSGGAVEKGQVISCDHCGRNMEVVAVINLPRVQVKQYHGAPIEDGGE